MSYGYIGSMKTRPGHRDEVVAILTRGAPALRDIGCHAYIVATATTDDQTIWVTEVWESATHHDDSLQLPEVRAAIAEAMPLLTGEFSSQVCEVVGGIGAWTGA
ncbi:putative quinol monooxygenase [Cellulomonas sp. P22]|uniref:putative quinol monooxygenase n=1 Tax=Cellulomonas sp. P22 TaxID=3373189 RepID=UPI0037B86148